MRQNRAGSWEAAQKDINIEPGMMMEGTVHQRNIITSHHRAPAEPVYMCYCFCSFI